MHKLTAVVLLAIAVSALGQATPGAAPPAAAPPPIAIHRASSPISIDGDLGDSAWQDAAKLENWVEGSPGNNIPAKVKTTAYLSYDDKYFYIGIRAEDPDAAKIRAPYVERDGVIGTDDNIAIFLDTRGDKRTSYEIRVNPRGIQADGIYDDSGPLEDFSPDYFYDTASKIDSGGWSSEFRIPFSSLRYSSRNPKFNILVWRNYPRDFRYAFYSAPVPRGSNCLVCHTQEITGLTDLPEAGHLTAAPYVASSRVDTPNVFGQDLGNHELNSNVGADIKFTPSGSNAIDLTINPDFSQVEADSPQITVNQRFAVFVSEKRPFFLEGFDLFNTPMQVLYTRTITSPRAGARWTGRTGSNAYTVLVTDDRGGGLTILPGALGSDFAAQDFRAYDAIARVRHEMGASYVGAVLTDREASGGGHNRVIGPDLLWRPSESDQVYAQLLYSDTTNPNRPDLSSSWNGETLRSTAFRGGWDHQKTRYDFGGNISRLGDDFRADLGFIPQVGYREGFAYAGLRFYPEHSLFSFVRPSINYDRQEILGGQTLYEATQIGVGVNGKRNLQAFIGQRINQQDLVRSPLPKEPDRLLTQSYTTWQIQFDPSRRFTRVAFSGRTGQATDYNNQRVGRGWTVNATAIMRPVDRTTFQFDAGREFLDIHGRRLYTAQFERLRTLYSFSANSIIRLIAQYSSTTRDPNLYLLPFPVPVHSGNFLGSLLYSYKLNWQTVLYLGYGDTRVLTAQNDLLRSDRSLFFKVSYAIQK